ncbi:DUF2487 family protein [Paenibacillus sp. BAC0078]
MKFSDFTTDSWTENGRFYDTCLLPLTGLSGTESPAEVTAALERLRDFLELVEKPFQGRIVTYPAVQYIEANSAEVVNEICRKVKSKTFQYVIVLTADVSLSGMGIAESDLLLSLTDIQASQAPSISSYISEKIQAMWQQGR